MSYPRLSIIEFGKHLLESNDLDPVYVALCKVPWTTQQIQRWLVAYWCFYDCVTACRLMIADKYWDQMRTAAENSDRSWRRGRERRHFRGSQGLAAVLHLTARYPHPENFVEGIMERAPEFDAISNFVQVHRGFGPWMSFKIADMLERVLHVPVDFTPADVFMYKDPREAAIMLWATTTKLPNGSRPSKMKQPSVVKSVVDYLLDEFKSYKAPPQHDRKLGLQEVETILCKWKSHMNGHYPLLNDVQEIRSGLKQWLNSPSHWQANTVVGEFLEAMP